MLGAKKTSWLILMAFAAAVTVLAAQELPQIEGDSLAGHHVVLPRAASGKIAVLVLGFSKASKTTTSAWGQKIETDFAATPELVLYQLPVLEDVPGVIRGMVISSIKKSVPENRRGYFIPVLNGESDLKKLVNYNQPDDAYLVLLDRSGQIVYQMHGPLSDLGYAELRGHIANLLR